MPALQVHHSTPVRIARSHVAPQALGAATSELHGSCVLAVATAQPNTGRMMTPGLPLRPNDTLIPSYTERAVMPYRHIHSRRDNTNEREFFVEGIYERVLRALLPANFPVDIAMQGSLVRCHAMNGGVSGTTGFNVRRLPDAPVLFGNALSCALTASNLIREPFAAVRVACRPGRQGRFAGAAAPADIVVNPSPDELHHAAPQMLYIGTATKPLHVAYDTIAGLSSPASACASGPEVVSQMLEVAQAAACESIAEQHDVRSQDADGIVPDWPSLLPSAGSVRVLSELCGRQIDTALSRGPISRAEQSLQMSQLEVQHLLTMMCHDCLSLAGIARVRGSRTHAYMIRPRKCSFEHLRSTAQAMLPLSESAENTPSFKCCVTCSDSSHAASSLQDSMREALFAKGLIRNDRGTGDSPSVSRWSLRPAFDAVLHKHILAMLQAGQRPFSHRGLRDMRSIAGGVSLPMDMSRVFMPSGSAMVGNGGTQVRRARRAAHAWHLLSAALLISHMS